MTVQDGDCTPDLVEPTGELGGRVALQSKLYIWTMLHGKVVRLLRDAPYLPEEDVDKLESQIQARYEKMLSYNTDSYLDSHIFVNYTKFRVFRHNLTPHAPYSSRVASLRRCIEMATNASVGIAEKFKDIETVSPQDAQAAYEHNQQVVRIMYPEHCQYLYWCAMFLVAAKKWKFALSFVIALRVIGAKLAINKCCCRYLWGVINFTEGRESIVPKEIGLEAFWPQDEEVLALIGADMNQDARAWEAVWQKEEKRPLLASVGSGETDVLEESASISEVSEIPSKVAFEVNTEDETWDSMVSFIRVKIEEEGDETPMEDINVVVTTEQEPDMDIQRRMSISNLL
jgi:hypothetical protein